MRPQPDTAGLLYPCSLSQRVGQSATGIPEVKWREEGSSLSRTRQRFRSEATKPNRFTKTVCKSISEGAQVGQAEPRQPGLSSYPETSTAEHPSAHVCVWNYTILTGCVTFTPVGPMSHSGDTQAGP